MLDDRQRIVGVAEVEGGEGPAMLMLCVRDCLRRALGADERKVGHCGPETGEPVRLLC